MHDLHSSEQESVQRYLDRIGYRGVRRPTVDVLHHLHSRHMLCVPFENLDIHLGKPIVLDQRAFYRKIVGARRGGYCYELNGCFAGLLKKLRFKVSMVSARVARKNGGFSPDFDHMALVVRLKERWLVDVGFGDSFTEPKRIDIVGIQKDDGYDYKINPENGRMVVSRRPEERGPWEPQYAFSLRPRRLTDFAARNGWQQVSPQSHFTKSRLISLLTTSGRLTLTDQKLVLMQNGKRKERPVKNARESLTDCLPSIFV